MIDRIENPRSIDRPHIEKMLADGCRPVIQFSEPGYSPRLLRSLDALCSEFGANIEVRFYGHYQDAFDASCLSQLPHVAHLSVDCLRCVNNHEALFELEHLEQLALGIFEFDAPDILDRLKIEKLHTLRVAETRKSNIDLTALTRCRALRNLQISGHTRGFAHLGELVAVSKLRLRSIPKKQSLAVVSRMPALRELEIILGGRDNINEIEHSELRSLEVVWVRGLTTMGSLDRFPNLHDLKIEDQLRVTSLDLRHASRELRSLTIANCKKLARIEGLGELPGLESLHISRTALDYDELLDAGLPSSVKAVSIYTGRQKTNEALRARLDALGYE